MYGAAVAIANNAMAADTDASTVGGAVVADTTMVCCGGCCGGRMTHTGVNHLQQCHTRAIYIFFTNQYPKTHFYLLFKLPQPL